MKQFISLILLPCLFSVTTYAGGSLVGSDDDNIKSSRTEISIDSGTAKDNADKGDSQVYYMGENETEVQFATNIKGSPKVNIKRLNPQVDFNKELFEGLKQSQETGEWVDLKNTDAAIKNFTENAGTLGNRLKGGNLKGLGGGLKGVGGGMGRGGF